MRSHKYDSLPPVLHDLVEHAPRLEEFDSNLNPKVQEAFQTLRKSGLYLFVHECIENNQNILISIAQFAASAHLHPGEKIPPISMKELILIKDTNETLHRYLNHIAINAAKEIGLLSFGQAAVLGAQDDLKKQDAKITTLNHLILIGHNKIRKLLEYNKKNDCQGKYRVPFTDDAETHMRALLSGNNILLYISRVRILEGYTELTKDLKFDKAKINWES